MDSDDVALLRRMVEIPSVTGAEAELAAYVAGRLNARGFDSHVDEVGNAVGAIGDPDAPQVLLLGHLDTVAGAPPVRVEADLLFGRGSVDAKGPLATMICAAQRAARQVAARFVVIGAVDEEGTSRGAAHLVDRYRPDAVVIGEPSGVDAVVAGYKGVFRFDYEVTRPPTHSSSPQEKATEVAVEFWTALSQRLARRYPDGALFDRALPALVSCQADMVTSRLQISCRTPVGFDTRAWYEELAQLGGDAVISVIEVVPAIRSPRTDPVVRAVTAAIRRHGRSPVTKLKLGTSDMNVVGPHWSVPIASYGPGDSRLDHCADEHISLRDYSMAIDILTEALVDLAQTLRAGGELATSSSGAR